MCKLCELARSNEGFSKRWSDPDKKLKMQIARKKRNSSPLSKMRSRENEKRSYLKKKEQDRSKLRSDTAAAEYQKYKKTINKNRHARIQNDPILKMRKWVSSGIYSALKNSGSSKRGLSVMSALPYSIEDLVKHIESLWEPWMSWDNHGKFTHKQKTWQIDHVYAQSLLPFDSLDHPNFLKCWSLENLRPLESIKNLEKGNKLESF